MNRRKGKGKEIKTPIPENPYPVIQEDNKYIYILKQALTVSLY